MKQVRNTVMLVALAGVLAASSALAQEGQSALPASDVDALELAYLSKALQQIEAEEPEFFEHLKRLERENPAEYRMILQDRVHQIRLLEELRSRSPDEYAQLRKLFDLEKQERGLAARYERARSEAERTQIEQKLRDLLPKLFDVRLEQQRREVAELERRLAEVKRDIQRRERNKDRIIARHLSELTGKRDELAW